MALAFNNMTGEAVVVMPGDAFDFEPSTRRGRGTPVPGSATMPLIFTVVVAPVQCVAWRFVNGSMKYVTQFTKRRGMRLPRTSADQRVLRRLLRLQDRSRQHARCGGFPAARRTRADGHPAKRG